MNARRRPVRGPRVPVPRPAGPRRLRRSIRFYRIYTRKVEGAIGPMATDLIPLTVAGVASRPDRYFDLGDGLGIDCEAIAGHNDRLLMRRVNWVDHPERYTLERGPQDLRLRPDEALSEPAHLRFFDGNILAAEITRSGPAPTMLRDFLRNRFPALFSTFQMLRVPDLHAMERLARIVTFKSAKIRLSGETLHRLPVNGANYLGLLRGMGEYGGDPGVFEVTWKLLRNNGDLNAEAIRQLAIAIIEQEGDDLDSTAQIQIEGNDANGRSETFVLQRHFLSVDRTIARGDNRRVDDGDAFRALGDAYNEVHERIPRVPELLDVVLEQ